jgi:phosphate transport system substrate-binding protein
LRVNRLFFLALPAVIATTVVGLTASAASAQGGSLVGAGSTLIAPLMQHWSSDFKSKTGISVTYGAVGSGAGIAQITARTVDFGASDAPLSGAQASACNGCVQIPWALTATGIAYRLDGVRSLKLTGPVLAQIYMGQITKWNDSRIRRLNKGVRLPNLAITPAFRSDGSGDTYAFTDYMSRVSRAWRRSIGFGTQVSFQHGVGGKGNDGIAAVVSSTNGSVGYISAAYIIAHGLKAAALRNRAGKFEFPNLSNIKSAGSSVKRVPGNNEMHIVNPSKRYRKAYPLSTFTYAIVPRRSQKANLLRQFINYAATMGQKFGPALDFSPIPKVVLKAAKRSTRRLQQG